MEKQMNAMRNSYLGGANKMNWEDVLGGAGILIYLVLAFIFAGYYEKLLKANNHGDLHHDDIVAAIAAGAFWFISFPVHLLRRKYNAEKPGQR